jgi:hypothetical protein
VAGEKYGKNGNDDTQQKKDLLSLEELGKIIKV